MMYWGLPFKEWVKILTREEIEDYKLEFKDYDNPLYKAYCVKETEVPTISVEEYIKDRDVTNR